MMRLKHAVTGCISRARSIPRSDISSPGGVRIHLHYDNPLGRVSDVKRIVDTLAVETLVQYRYDDNGQLIEVIKRNGDSMRRFSYAEGMMASHSIALGLRCHYRWETIDGQPRVVEHWTSDGEHFHFRYDFKNRFSWAVDVLGHELDVQYNEDKRVIASRDFGGERYGIDLDDAGNTTVISLPDGSRLESPLRRQGHPCCQSRSARPQDRIPQQRRRPAPHDC